MDHLGRSRRIYQRLAALGGRPVPRLKTWTGETMGPEDARATLVLRHPGALRALLLPFDDLTAGEAYVFDDADVEGDMVSLMKFASELPAAVGPGQRLLLLRDLLALPKTFRRNPAMRPRFSGRRHSRARDEEAVRHHYDTGNDFFRLFLDPLMVYSCAHFLSPGESLEQAQRRKLDLICRKLDLEPGDRFLDVGCGWGALVVHAAQHYGVEATGVTVSGEQAELATQRAKELGVDDRVQILHADYRELGGTFDAIASVGMFEHVGRRKLPEYFTHLRSLLAPGGQLLNHGITTRDPNRHENPKSFVMTYVFPDGDLRPVDEAIEAAEDAGFELRDAESLRASYALTLRQWVENLEANAEAARDVAGDRTYRIWRLYMAGSAVAFERAAISVYQLLLSDPARPWTFGRKRLLASDDV